MTATAKKRDPDAIATELRLAMREHHTLTLAAKGGDYSESGRIRPLEGRLEALRDEYSAATTGEDPAIRLAELVYADVIAARAELHAPADDASGKAPADPAAHRKRHLGHYKVAALEAELLAVKGDPPGSMLSF